MAMTKQGWIILRECKSYTTITNENNIIRFDLRDDDFGIKIFDAENESPCYLMKNLKYRLYCGNEYDVKKFIDDMEYIEVTEAGLYSVIVGAFTLNVTLTPNNDLIVQMLVNQWEV